MTVCSTERTLSHQFHLEETEICYKLSIFPGSVGERSRDDSVCTFGVQSGTLTSVVSYQESDTEI